MWRSGRGAVFVAVAAMYARFATGGGLGVAPANLSSLDMKQVLAVCAARDRRADVLLEHKCFGRMNLMSWLA